MKIAFFIKVQRQDLVMYLRIQTTIWLSQEQFRNTLIKTCNYIVYDDTCFIIQYGMPIKRSTDLKKLCISKWIDQSVIADFPPDGFPMASSPASYHLFNNAPTGPSYDRIKYLSLIMAIMYVARFTRPDILLAISFLATKCNVGLQ